MLSSFQIAIINLTNKKAEPNFVGHPAMRIRPEAFRPYLAASLTLSINKFLIIPFAILIYKNQMVDLLSFYSDSSV